MNAVRARRAGPIVTLVVLLAACAPSPRPAPTAAPAATTVAAPTLPAATLAPTVAPTLAPTAAPTVVPPATPAVPAMAGPRFAYQAPDNRVRLSDAAGHTILLTTAAFPFDATVVFPAGRATSSTLYLLSTSGPGGRQGAYAVDAHGVRALDFITRTGYMLAVWPGDAKHKPRLAWNASESSASGMASAIYTSNADGTELRMLTAEDSQDGHILMPLRWSHDGQRLFYSNEPTGFGGYILFPGVSSLSVYDLAKNAGTTLIAEGSLGLNHFLCIVDISPDDRLAAHTCDDQHAVTVVPLGGGAATGIDSPPDVAQAAHQRGTALFSPDGTRVAYAAARGEIDDELGWALLARGLEGTASVIAISGAGDFFTVRGWLDASTLVLQSGGQMPAVWLARTDGSAPVKVGDGMFLAVIP